jgi:hypothetical protein
MNNWHYIPKEAITWWESLSINEKVDFKNRFEIFRNRDDIIKLKYPHMYDLRHIRISKLSDKHIVRIWVFRDRI